MAEKKVDSATVTLGEYLDAFRAIAPVKPGTLLSYERKFRKLVADIMNVQVSKKEKSNYFNKAAESVSKRIDATPLSAITPERVAKWRELITRKRQDKQFDSRTRPERAP